MRAFKSVNFPVLVSFLLLSSILVLSEAMATTYYISPNGNDNNPGTESQPWQNLEVIPLKAKAGDVINIMAGIYRPKETINLTSSRFNGSDTNRTIIRGIGDVLIDNSVHNVLVFSLGWGNAHGFTFENLKFKGGQRIFILNIGADYVTIRYCKFSGITEWNGSSWQNQVWFRQVSYDQTKRDGTGEHGLIEYNEFENTLGAIDLKTSLNIVRYNTFHNIYGGNIAHAITVKSANTGSEIYGNLFYNLSPEWPKARAISLGGDGWAAGIKFYNNLIYDSHSTHDRFGAVHIGDCRDCSVYNNTIANCKIAFELTDPNQNKHTRVVNNIISHMESAINYVNGHDPGVVFDNNLWFDTPGAPVEPNGIYENPLFVEPANGNYKLLSNSPAINQGVNPIRDDPDEDVIAPEVDFDGSPRDTNVDIGAFEYGGANDLQGILNASSTSGPVPLSVNFNGNVSGGTPPYGFAWDFGDSSHSTEQNPAHTFEAAGTYHVSLTVTDSENTAAPASVIIIVSDLPHPTDDSITALKARTPLTIDGTLSDDDWNQAENIAFSNPGRSDNQVKVSTLWDDTHLYFAYEVTDSHMEAENQKLWQDDGAEIFLDTHNNKSGSMDSDDYHFMININDFSNPAGIDVRTVTKTDGYTIEIAIPWSLLNTVPSKGKVLGLLLGNNDRDNGSYSQFDWPGLIDTGNYFRPGLWGEIVLSGETGAACDGDLNGDGQVNVADLQLMVLIILGTNSEANCADLDEDGVINVADLQGLINRILMK